MSKNPSLLASVARWCVEHRRRALIAWVVLLVAALTAASAVGTRQANEFSLKGTESQRAQDLLKRAFPAQAGDIDQIVFHARRGRITDPRVRDRIAPVLARVARLPHVTGVTGPYVAGQISRDGRIAFATVTFDKQAPALSKPSVQRVISAAEQARGPDLQVELGGAAIEQAQNASFGAASVVGLAAAIVVLLIAFGSVVAMGLPIVTALLGLGTGFGAIALASQVIDMPDFSSELAAMIGLGVGIDYSLFVVTRFRENHRNGDGVRAATLVAMDTAGRAVLFAGSTVIIALLGMLVLGLSFLDGLAISSALAVLFTMLAALTALPALLSRIGGRIGRGRWAPSPQAVDASSGTGFWARWARLIRRRPWPAAIAGLTIMLVVAVPALSMRMDLSDAGNDPAGTTTRKAYDLLADGFGRGFNGPLQIVAQLPHPNDKAALRDIAATLRGTPGVVSISPPRISASGRTAVYQAFPRFAPQAAATGDLVRTLRDTILPPVAQSRGATVLVGGPTAGSIDFTHVLSSKLPLFIAAVVGLAALLLLVVFRSVVIRSRRPS